MCSLTQKTMLLRYITSPLIIIATVAIPGCITQRASARPIHSLMRSDILSSKQLAATIAWWSITSVCSSEPATSNVTKTLLFHYLSVGWTLHVFNEIFHLYVAGMLAMSRFFFFYYGAYRGVDSLDWLITIWFNIFFLALLWWASRYHLFSRC